MNEEDIKILEDLLTKARAGDLYSIAFVALAKNGSHHRIIGDFEPIWQLGAARALSLAADMDITRAIRSATTRSPDTQSEGNEE